MVVKIIDSPGNGFAITASDGSDLAHDTRAINVASSGNVAVLTPDGDSFTVYVAAGIAFPIRARRVLSTGTTATGIVGLY